MSEETKTKKFDEPIDFEVLERASVPKRNYPRASKWKTVLEAAVANEGKFVLVRLPKQTTASGEVKERPARSLMAALTGFAKRHPDLLQGKKLRTQTHAEGGVLVWTSTPQDQTELPLDKKTAAA